MALGATPASVVRLVLRRLVVVLAAGVIGGAVLSLWLAGFVGTLLFGLEARDPVTLIGATAVLVFVSGLATWLPARRAARIDPTQALREG